MVRMRQFIPFGYACQYPFLPKGKKYKGSSSTDFMKKLQARKASRKDSSFRGGRGNWLHCSKWSVVVCNPNSEGNNGISAQCCCGAGSEESSTGMEFSQETHLGSCSKSSCVYLTTILMIRNELKASIFHRISWYVIGVVIVILLRSGIELVLLLPRWAG
jgi:hypothetical protein